MWLAHEPFGSWRVGDGSRERAFPPAGGALVSLCQFAKERGLPSRVCGVSIPEFLDVEKRSGLHRSFRNVSAASGL